MAAMQAQIQALLAAQGAGAGREATGSHLEVAKLAIFSGEAGKVGGFISACKIYIRNRMRGDTMERQVQWVLSYVQGGSVDVWKENVMKELEAGEVEYESVEEFLTILKKEFREGEEEAVKAAELRRVEQGGKTMEEYVQEFKRIARGSGYKGRPLVEEFKRGMNRGIRRKLMETKNPPASIEQWYKKAMALDRNQRESKKEKERLKRKQEKKTSTFWQPLALINRGSKIQVWPRRQEMQQQTSMGPAPIERIERTNTVVVRGLGQDAGVPPRWDLFAMEVD